MENSPYPPARSEVAETLQIVLTTMIPPRVSRGGDRFLWRNGEGHFVPKFSTKATWHSIHCQPGTDLHRGGISVPLQCVLCSSELESHHHLFFQCSFVQAIWTRYCGNLIPSVPSSLQAVAVLLSNHQIASSPGLSAVIKLLLQCIIYSVWWERNSRIFRQTASTEPVVIAHVERLVRDRFISIPPSSPTSPSLLQVFYRLPPSVP
ncbi:uncharacterized protein LOC108819804 [Raphanus sativus]|uniref:Uncharacterized protein LOC108819804 n=1 Tax=Raphanus sativus TaxID=3726 RepID=A0A6J0KMT5_RAPSA|nr:uncharacterized protein LOC108819804 [Raphanus sativus]